MSTNTEKQNNRISEKQILQINEVAGKHNLIARIAYNTPTEANFYFTERKPAGTEESIHSGMQCNVFDDGFEVSQYQAGEKANELHIYGLYPTLKGAISSLLKGNSKRRKPIQIYK